MSIVNKLFYGDCLSVMQDMRLGSVDLIYLDPPFNSDRTYNAIYRDSTGRELPEQKEGFSDIWELSPDKQRPVLAGSRAVSPDLARLEGRVGCRLQILDVAVAASADQQQDCGE